MSEMPGPVELSSFGTGLNVAVVGATGGIGAAFVEELIELPSVSRVFALSRVMDEDDDGRLSRHRIDIAADDSIAAAAAVVADTVESLHLVLVATGILHDGDRIQPEKSWRALDATALETAFRVNTIGPALVAKHFLPLLASERKAAFAALSARVGSIEDNRLGGWHAYRASKAALNMMIRTLSVELARRNPTAFCVGLHPGTVDTRLSQPFQSAVPAGKLFAPQRAARHLLGVLDRLGPADSGRVFAWDGKPIPA